LQASSCRYGVALGGKGLDFCFIIISIEYTREYGNPATDDAAQCMRQS